MQCSRKKIKSLTDTEKNTEQNQKETVTDKIIKTITEEILRPTETDTSTAVTEGLIQQETRTMIHVEETDEKVITCTQIRIG